MTIKNRKHEHGWRAMIEDVEGEERYSGNIADTEDEARTQAIDGFIEHKKDNIKKVQKEIAELKEHENDILNSIVKLKEMK